MLHAAIFWLIMNEKRTNLSRLLFLLTTSCGDSGVKADGLLRQRCQMFARAEAEPTGVPGCRSQDGLWSLDRAVGSESVRVMG